VSIRDTKKLATLAARESASPLPARTSSPAIQASAARRYAARENRSVTLTLTPSAASASMAGMPAGVPGILMKTFGRASASTGVALLDGASRVPGEER
jgi:hypothetical protein